MFVTEGSTDGTTEYLANYPSITLISGHTRRGKIQAINSAIRRVTSPIVIFTDANSILNKDAVLQIVKHYANAEVGAVAGEKRVFNGDYEQASAAGEGLYWKYESLLKRLDSELYTTVGAAGELFSIRTELYQRVRKDTLLDDFIISLKIAAQGYKVVYEPKAYAMEEASFSIEEEMKRKVRISTGGFQSVVRLLYLLNPMQYGLLTFQYVSHRVLRWTVAPFCLPLAFLCNAMLIKQAFLYESLFIMQFLFYMLAFAGYLFEKRKLTIKAFFIPFYFIFMNYSVYLGFFQFIANKQSVKWEKARRAEAIA
jgi:cellulose synthase/poly-beta-1,6-N-acetylglucosamine synthase-like glycosyltransferase